MKYYSKGILSPFFPFIIRKYLKSHEEVKLIEVSTNVSRNGRVIQNSNTEGDDTTMNTSALIKNEHFVPIEQGQLYPIFFMFYCWTQTHFDKNLVCCIFR
jgi:hypothetical protein